MAKEVAKRCTCDLIVDGFCGAGGNAIQFAFTCKKGLSNPNIFNLLLTMFVSVIAIDIDPKKIELARNNAEVYGVADRIEFIVGDFMQLANAIKADVVFLSPPWGGPTYLKSKTYELDEVLLPVPVTQLLNCARTISKNIALYLPRNSNVHPVSVIYFMQTFFLSNSTHN